MALADRIIQQAAQAIGTPFYAYCGESMRATARALKTALPAAEFVYSLKANPNVSIVRLLTGEGIGAEFCSGFELEACIAAGVAGERMIFVGPAKSAAEITRAVEAGVKAIIAESLGELSLIGQIAAGKRVIQPVALRINPEFHTPGARLSMSGRATQFGMDGDDIAPAMQLIKAHANLRLAGLHVYMGTRILDHEVVAQNSRNIFLLAQELINQAGHPLDFVDVGGGFGVAYHDGETALDLAALGRTVNPLIEAFKSTNPGTQVIIELGRYMVAGAGVFVTAVRYVKTVKGKRFAVCDGGSNCHSAAAQGASFRRNFPVSAVNPAKGPLMEWQISGPLCTPTDIIGQSVMLPPLRPGDLIRIDQSGAYGLTASNVNFLSFATPAEVLWDHKSLTQIRARGTVKSHLDPQTPRPVPVPQFETELA